MKLPFFEKIPNRIFAIAAGLFLILFAAVIRIPLHDILVWDWDESIYLYVAKAWSGSILPYRDLFDHKGPLLYGLLKGLLVFSGNSISQFRLVSSIYLGLSAVWIFLGLRRFEFNKVNSIGASMLYVLLMSYSSFDGEATNGEFLMMGFVCLLFYVCAPLKKISSLKFFLMGAISAIAFFIKPTAVFSCIPFVLLAIITDSFRANIRKLIYCSLGALSIVASIVVYFAWHDALDSFIWSFWSFNFSYVARASFLVGINRAYAFFAKNIFLDAYTSFSLMAAGFVLIWGALGFRSRKKVVAGFPLFALLFVFSLLGALWGRNAFPHYFLQLALPLSLGVACFYQVILRWVSLNVSMLLWVIFFLITSFISIPNRNLSQRKTRLKAQEALYLPVVSRLKLLAGSEKSLFLLGGEPIIYFLADMQPPTTPFISWPMYSKENIVAFENRKKNFINLPFDSDYIVYAPSLLPSRMQLTREMNSIIEKKYALIFQESHYKILRIIQGP